MNADHYKQLYQDRLPVGQRFQDHCALQVMKNLNIPLVNLQSKDYQFKIGENLQGFEIKYDQSFANTNNLYIETEHRVSPDQEYYKGGILRDDNSWLYCIGNYEVIYIFSKKFLRRSASIPGVGIVANSLKIAKAPKTKITL